MAGEDAHSNSLNRKLPTSQLPGVWELSLAASYLCRRQYGKVEPHCRNWLETETGLQFDGARAERLLGFAEMLVKNIVLRVE